MARIRSDKLYIFVFFGTVIMIGSLLLFLPQAWAGPARLSYIDALFTATSAVCVTGLITVDTALYTQFGKLVIMLLIQVGGLGIISFATLHLLIPRMRVSFTSLRIIQGYYLGGVEHNPKRIIRNVLLFTLLIEAAGALGLYFCFQARQADRAWFTALFHSISAFNNAGFSTFSDNLEGYKSHAPVLLVVMALIITGGLGYIVLQEVAKRFASGKYRLSFHSKMVLGVSLALIFGGAVLFYFFEQDNLLSPMPFFERILNALFQSVTPRTAGFNSLVQNDLTLPSKLFTMFLMFTGGAPGGTAGGVKVTTMFILFMYILRGQNESAVIQFARRRLSVKTISSTTLFVSKAFALLFLCIFLLTITEARRLAAGDASLAMLMFETISAFGTVGLSLGVTSSLSAAGKLVIIFTMFAGRIGLVTMAMPAGERRAARITYPEGEVLLG